MATVRMTTIFKPVYLERRVSLSPAEFREAAEDLDGYLLQKLKKELEGQCCTHGYVNPGSTQILARSMGQAEHGKFTGDFIYYCKLRIQTFLPYANQIVNARVFKMNKIGAYALILEDGKTSEAMRILIPRDLHLGNQEFDSLQVGAGVRVKLLRSRFQNNDAFIQGVGLYEGTVDITAVQGGEETALPPLMPAVAATETA
jgi:DNA-directed RNA polymerase subunit E'/Rpb7